MSSAAWEAVEVSGLEKESMVTGSCGPERSPAAFHKSLLQCSAECSPCAPELSYLLSN